MIYVLHTTSIIINDIHYENRKKNYLTHINNNIEFFKDIPNIKFIIVENTGISNSFLDNLNCPVIYTDTNNTINSINKGHKELIDILKVIEKYNINDDDFIIKITGSYAIQNNSKFINTIKNINLEDIDCVIRYGSFYDIKASYRINDCITGLIGMKVKNIKQIKIPNEEECVEWEWAKVANTIPDDRIIMLDHLGIFINPAENIR